MWKIQMIWELLLQIFNENADEMKFMALLKNAFTWKD